MVSDSAVTDGLAPFDEVLFSLLFGSRADGSPRPDSDLDVAVYLDPRLTPKQRWESRLKLQAALDVLGPVELVILNDAPPLLAHRALLGKPIEIRDRRTYVRFFVQSLACAEDERHYRSLHRTARRQRLEEGRFGRP